MIFKLPTRQINTVPNCLLIGGEMKLDTQNVQLEAVVLDPEISCPLYGLIFKMIERKIILYIFYIIGRKIFNLYHKIVLI